MRSFEDTRTPAMKAADLEQSQIRVQLADYYKELENEGFNEAEIYHGQVDHLEDVLVRLYCAYYELSAEMEGIS